MEVHVNMCLTEPFIFLVNVTFSWYKFVVTEEFPGIQSQMCDHYIFTQSILIYLKTLIQLQGVCTAKHDGKAMMNGSS
jgi:hypothetical protein